MHILVIGSGGREHAVIARLLESGERPRVTCAPGNAGIATVCDVVDLAPGDVRGIVTWAQENHVDLVVATPEEPLAAGLVDLCDAAGIAAFGPTQAAARIESSKAFAKALMVRKGVPTAQYGDFTDPVEAATYTASACRDGLVVVKASGLAAGKGAVVADSEQEAQAAIREMLVERKFGAACERIIIEERLIGEEASVFALCDGTDFVTLLSSQDHKAVGEGDTGPNTGGMGAYAPAPVVDAKLMARIEREILAPTLEGLAEEGAPFKGVLYCGLMISPGGDPQVIEYNARFGDPETQVVLPLLETDLVELMQACVAGGIRDVPLKWRAGAATCVVLASGGYPGSYAKGKVMTGLDEDFGPHVSLYHAGTARRGDDVVTTGGRVLGVTAWGETLRESARRAYAACDRIEFEGKYLRRDIGWRAWKREEQT